MIWEASPFNCVLSSLRGFNALAGTSSTRARGSFFTANLRSTFGRKVTRVGEYFRPSLAAVTLPIAAYDQSDASACERLTCGKTYTRSVSYGMLLYVRYILGYAVTGNFTNRVVASRFPLSAISSLTGDMTPTIRRTSCGCWTAFSTRTTCAWFSSS